MTWRGMRPVHVRSAKLLYLPACGPRGVALSHRTQKPLFATEMCFMWWAGWACGGKRTLYVVL